MSIPYSEDEAVRFGLGCNDVYTESGGQIDPGMIAVHSQREAWDVYVNGMEWDPAYYKHINEFRGEYGLPPIDDPTPPTPGYPGIDLDLSTVTVLGSDPAILTYPTTAQLNEIGVQPGTLTLHTTGCENWPMVPVEVGDSPSQAGTLWVFERIAGLWYSTGAERLRPEQLNGGKPESSTVNTWIGTDWLYDASRWGIMTGYNPKPGEIVGFMVVAGSTRSDNNTPIDARSRVAMFRWPSSHGALPVEILEYV